MNPTRGRPKGQAKQKPHSPSAIGDLIRNARLEHRLGLADVASACRCSVQFVSNIEHGRVPMPWKLVAPAVKLLKKSP